MRVYCVYRTGGRYTPEWVERLERGVRRFWPDWEPLTFIPLSDSPALAARPLRWTWPGWWAKLDLFRELGALPADGLYLDLDNVIFSDLSPLVKIVVQLRFEGVDGFRAMRDPYRDDGGLQSAVMGWSEAWARQRAGAIYERFAPLAEQYMSAFATGGDQAFIEAEFRRNKWPIRHFPEAVVASYKKFLMRMHETELPAVAQFHGEPKPDALPADHVARRFWV